MPGGTPSPAGAGVLEMRVVAGPVCPVETEPPDPSCDPRPVEGARILVQPGDGRDIVVGEGVSDDAGIVRLSLPAGEYVVVGLDAEGLFGSPDPVRATVVADDTTVITLGYDTGIR